jgi:hypothetical protein
LILLACLALFLMTTGVAQTVQSQTSSTAASVEPVVLPTAPTNDVRGSPPPPLHEEPEVIVTAATPEPVPVPAAAAAELIPELIPNDAPEAIPTVAPQAIAEAGSSRDPADKPAEVSASVRAMDAISVPPADVPLTPSVDTIAESVADDIPPPEPALPPSPSIPPPPSTPSQPVLPQTAHFSAHDRDVLASHQNQKPHAAATLSEISGSTIEAAPTPAVPVAAVISPAPAANTVVAAPAVTVPPEPSPVYLPDDESLITEQTFFAPQLQAAVATTPVQATTAATVTTETGHESPEPAASPSPAAEQSELPVLKVAPSGAAPPSSSSAAAEKPEPIEPPPPVGSASPAPTISVSAPIPTPAATLAGNVATLTKETIPVASVPESADALQATHVATPISVSTPPATSFAPNTTPPAHRSWLFSPWLFDLSPSDALATLSWMISSAWSLLQSAVTDLGHFDDWLQLSVETMARSWKTEVVSVKSSSSSRSTSTEHGSDTPSAAAVVAQEIQIYLALVGLVLVVLLSFGIGVAWRRYGTLIQQLGEMQPQQAQKS